MAHLLSSSVKTLLRKVSNINLITEHLIFQAAVGTIRHDLFLAEALSCKIIIVFLFHFSFLIKFNETKDAFGHLGKGGCYPIRDHPSRNFGRSSA
jgi:hypothetical protein